MKNLKMSIATMVLLMVSFANAQEKDFNRHAPVIHNSNNSPSVFEPGKPIENNEAIFEFVELMPEFIGGEDSLNKYLENHLGFH